MIDISLEKNRNLYENYQDCLNFLNNLDFDKFEYPEGITNFHMYSDMRNEKELLAVESYLATQNLEKTKLIFWSDFDLSGNKLLDPYRNLIDMRVYNPREEMLGTILENCEKWINASDSKYYMKSGVLRFLVTHKYGGIWSDIDMILLKDFKPILDQEWAYVWGSELDFINFGPCAAMMSMHKNSYHSNLCMSEMLNSPHIADTTTLDHAMLAKVYSKKPFYIMPTTFFNTEWNLNTQYVNGIKQYNHNGEGTLTESGWFVKNEYSNRLFDGAFAWHWHNSSYKNHLVQEGSKFDLFSKRTKKILKEKGIL
jgi:hypothetical protein